MRVLRYPALAALLLFRGALGDCVANTTSTMDMQLQLQAGGANFTLSLCQGQIYSLTDILNFTNTNQVSASIPSAARHLIKQEISTENYPTDGSRATLVVTQVGQSIAVQATNEGLNGCKLRHVQVRGRRSHPVCLLRRRSTGIELVHPSIQIRRV